MSAATNSWIQHQKTIQSRILDSHTHADAQQHTQQQQHQQQQQQQLRTHDVPIYEPHTHSPGLYPTTHTHPLSPTSLYHDRSSSPSPSLNRASDNTSHSLSHSSPTSAFAHTYEQMNSLSHTPSSSSSSSSSSGLLIAQSIAPSTDTDHISPPLTLPFPDSSSTQQQSNYRSNYTSSSSSSSYEYTTRYSDLAHPHQNSTRPSNYLDPMHGDDDTSITYFENRTHSTDPGSLPSHIKSSSNNYSSEEKDSFRNLESRSIINGIDEIEKDKIRQNENVADSEIHNKSELDLKSYACVNDSNNGNDNDNEPNESSKYADHHDSENLKTHQNNVYRSTIVITNSDSSYDSKIGSNYGRRMTLTDDVAHVNIDKVEQGSSYQIQIQSEDFLKISGLS